MTVPANKCNTHGQLDLQTATSVITKYRCNSVLDLRGRKISDAVWKGIQYLISEDKVTPPIDSIYLANSNVNVSRSQLHPIISDMLRL